MFEIELSKQAEQFYLNTDTKTARCLNSCFKRLSQNPFRHKNIRKLHGEFEGSYRYRAGNLRVIYSVDNARRTIVIEVIGDRKDIYR
jgi:mRNA interferase RelE/StbE